MLSLRFFFPTFLLLLFTCHMEGLDKEFVIIICNLRELAVVFDDSQGIEGTCYDECDEC